MKKRQGIFMDDGIIYLTRPFLSAICLSASTIAWSHCWSGARQHGFWCIGGMDMGGVVQHGQVTGVLNWVDAAYGDCVYDIVWLDYYAHEQQIPMRVWHQYQAHEEDIPHYFKRLHCYECHISLDALRFFVKANNPSGYAWIRDRIMGLLKVTPSQSHATLRDISCYPGVS